MSYDYLSTIYDIVYILSLSLFQCCPVLPLLYFESSRITWSKHSVFYSIIFSFLVSIFPLFLFLFSLLMFHIYYPYHACILHCLSQTTLLILWFPFLYRGPLFCKEILFEGFFCNLELFFSTSWFKMFISLLMK